MLRRSRLCLRGAFGALIMTSGLMSPALAAVQTSCPQVIPTVGLFDYRAISSPFSSTLPAVDNVLQSFGYNVSGVVAPAVTDGYWLLLAPLPVGNHTINFGGTFGLPDIFTLDITYHITVTP